MKKSLLTAFLLIAAFAASAQKNTALSYIEQFKENAIRIMQQSGVPASIIMAVAMHESGCGNSNVARNLNNQFGVVAPKSSYYYKHKKKVRTKYKRYDSILDSFDDFARIITGRKPFCMLSQQLSFDDYEGWVHGIAKGGYAGSKKWGPQVLAIIRKYQLNALDARPDSTVLAQNAQ